MPDVDQATLIELGKLALQVGHNPKTRRQFFQAVKEIAPERYAAQIDQRVEDQLEEIRREREADKLAREQEKVTTRLEAARAALLSRYSEDDVKKIETDVMQRYGISDYEAAAKLYAADNVPANPRNDPPKTGATWEMPNFEGLVKNPVKAARDMAFSVIDELNRGKR